MKASTKIFLRVCCVVVVLLVCATGVMLYGHFDGWFVKTGWQHTEDGIVQYLDEKGEPLLGWQDIDDGRYYFRSNTGMATGWQDIDGKRYYLSDNGIMLTGWLTVENEKYYLNADGSMAIGWLDLDGATYYLGTDGRMVTGWQDVAGKRYYLSADGAVQYGWLEIDGERYYLSDDGSLRTGWLKLDNGKYYLNKEGKPVTGWLDLEDDHYYFGVDGVMKTGWLDYKGDRYYLLSDRRMAIGEVKIDNVASFFTSKGKYVYLVNRWNPVPKGYSPKLVKFSGYKIDESCVDSLEQLLKACKKAGYSYSVNSIYRSKTQQQKLWDKRYNKYIESGYSKDNAYNKVLQSVAVPGTSEHHLGLAADVGGSQKMYKWMREHSWEYGFIVRYPEGKTDYTGIIHEPWHIRYVGKELAKELYKLNMCMEEYMQMLTKKQAA